MEMTEDTAPSRPSDQAKLQELWKVVDAGDSSPQDRIDALALSGRLRERKSIQRVRELTRDDDEEVRSFALQTLVLDLDDKTDESAELCWRLLENDLDEDVQATAATCLGGIFFGTNRVDIFKRLAERLRTDTPTSYVKGAIYGALFRLAGRPPSEWPGLIGPRRVFEESDIDWGRVAELEDAVRRAASAT